jgi:hypothetical protein
MDNAGGLFVICFVMFVAAIPGAFIGSLMLWLIVRHKGPRIS